jgi:hypothetical protein
MIFQNLFSRLFKRKQVYHGDHSFSTIPQDVGVYIMSFLTFKEVLNVSLVSRHYNLICGSDMLWEEFCALKWKQALNTQLVNIDYKNSIAAHGAEDSNQNMAQPGSRKSMGEIHAGSESYCLSESFGKKFLETLRKNYDTNSTWKDIFLSTLLFTHNDTSVIGDGLFYWLGCYDHEMAKRRERYEQQLLLAQSRDHYPMTHYGSFGRNAMSLYRKKLIHHNSLNTLTSTITTLASGTASTSIAGSTSIHYQNPAEITADRIHKVRLTASSQKVGKSSSWISRQNTASWTENSKFEYFQVDLGQNLSFVPIHYQMRYGSKSYKVLPKSWVLQGSRDAQHWVNLRVHENDESFKKQDYALASWPIDPNTTSHFGEAFRYFRVKLTGKTNSSHQDWDYTLVVTGFELFGFAIVPRRFHTAIDYCYATRMNNLIYAIANKSDIEVVKRCFEEVSPHLSSIDDKVTPFGESLLHIAAQYNYDDCVKWLIEEKNASINNFVDSGDSVFDVASSARMKDFLYQINMKRMQEDMRQMKESFEFKLAAQNLLLRQMQAKLESLTRDKQDEKKREKRERQMELADV